MSVAAPAFAPRWFSIRSTGRLIWHQLRTTRSLWCSLAVFLCIAQWLAAQVVEQQSDTAETLQFLTGVGAILFVLVAPAIAYSQEYEARTRDRLLMLPGSWRQSIGVVTGCIVFETLLLILIGIANLVVVLLVKELEITPKLSTDTIKVFPVLLLGLLLGTAGALTCRSTISAIICSAGALLGVMLLGTIIENTGPLFVVAVGIAALPLIVVDLVLARKWFGQSERDGFALPTMPTMPALGGNSTKCPAALARTPRRERQTQARGDFRTMVWREASATRLWFALAIAATVLVPLLQRDSEQAILLTLLGGTVGGFLSFRGDQFQSRIRFLSERGIASTNLWLSKHRVWLFRTAVWCVFFVWMAWFHGAWNFPRPIALLDIALAVLAAYATGQVCSIWFRNIFTALGATAFGSCVVGTWMVLSMSRQVPFWASLSPVIVAMFLASWLFCRQWMNQRGGFAAYWPGARIVGASFVVCYVCFGLYRFLEVPLEYELVPRSFAADQEVPIDTSSPRVLPGETEANAKSTSEYRSIAKSLIPRVIGRNVNRLPPRFHRIDRAPINWGDMSSVTQAWVSENRHYIEEIVRLIDSGSFYFDSNLDKGMEVDESFIALSHRESSRRSYLLFGEHYLPLMLLELEGAKRHADGDFAAAERLYASAITGYWLTVNSDNPGRDIQTAYAAAGHVFRRMGELGCEMESLENPISTTRIRIATLLRQRPRLEHVNARIAQTGYAASQPDAPGAKITSVHQLGGPGPPRWVVSQMSRRKVVSRPDYFTFGARSHQLSRLFHGSSHAAIAAARASGRSVASLLPQCEWAWENLRVNWPHWECTWFSGDINPAWWLHAELDLKTDVAAALELIDLAVFMRTEPDQRAALDIFQPLREDPWQTQGPSVISRLQWYPNGPGIADIEVNGLRSVPINPQRRGTRTADPESAAKQAVEKIRAALAAREAVKIRQAGATRTFGRNMPADAPMFVSVGSPVRSIFNQHYKPDRADDVGGPRYYPVPESVVAKWLHGATQDSDDE